MRTINALLSSALVVGLIFVPTLSAGTVTQITLGDFAGPLVLDFESEATGAIADNDAMFAAIGISSISATAETYTDDFQNRQNSSTRALWVIDENQLVIVDPASSGAAQYGQSGIRYTINLSTASIRFGFSTHDEPFAAVGADPLTITFYFGLTEVGSISSSGVLLPGAGPSPQWDRRNFFFENTDLFDRVVLTTNAAQNQGFALDNLVTDPGAGLTGVPEPGTLSLLGLGLLGIAAASRRRRR